MDIIAFLIYTVIMGFTPGPNNIMVMTSGVNFGFQKSIPHILGITIGFPVMLFLMSLGFGVIFETYPQILFWMKIMGGIYLMYLAWQIANAKPMNTTDTENISKPLSFLQAAFFQWVNPKAWVFALNTLAIYLSPEISFTWQISIIIGTSLLVTLCTVSLWTGFGTLLRSFLSNPQYNRIFNVTMALLLIASFGAAIL